MEHPLHPEHYDEIKQLHIFLGTKTPGTVTYSYGDDIVWAKDYIIQLNPFFSTVRGHEIYEILKSIIIHINSEEYCLHDIITLNSKVEIPLNDKYKFMVQIRNDFHIALGIYLINNLTEEDTELISGQERYLINCPYVLYYKKVE